MNKKSKFFSFYDSEQENDDDNAQNTALVSMIMLPQMVGNYLTENLLASQGHCSMEQVIKSVNKSYRYLCLMILFTIFCLLL